jgi:hypothetical protein
MWIQIGSNGDRLEKTEYSPPRPYRPGVPRS